MCNSHHSRGVPVNALEMYSSIAFEAQYPDHWRIAVPTFLNSLEVAGSKKSTTRYRDAVDGQFITKREADKRPRESVKEQIPLPKKPK